MSDTLFGIFIILFILLLAFTIFIVVDLTKKDIKIVCEKAYFVDTSSFWSVDKFMGYIDETTIEKVREMAGDAIIYESQECIKVDL